MEAPHISEPVKETVIIVHGTWAAPDPLKRRWYQPIDDRPGDEPFVAKLDAALQTRGSPARCWAHCTEGNPIFSWSGENSWIARTNAAAALADYVTKLRKEGWRCHIIAHSHGGNVVVEALPQILATPDSDDSHRRLVTLGTPFMDTMSPILKRAKWRHRAIMFLFWTALAILGYCLTIYLALWFVAWYYLGWNADLQAIAAHGKALGEAWSGYLDENPWLVPWIPWIMAAFTAARLPIDFLTLTFGNTISFLIVILAFVGLFVGRSLHVKRYRSRANPWAICAKSQTPRLLIVGSGMDESWQILHHLSSINNPLAIRSNLFVYLFSSLRSAISQNWIVDRIHGAKSYSDLGNATKVTMILMYCLIFLALAYAVYGAYLLSSSMVLPTWYGFFLASAFFFAAAVPLSIVMIILFILLGESFLSAFFSPFRWCARQVWALRILFPAGVTYLVRYLGWSVLLKIAIGLEGYRFEIPPIDQQHFSLLPENFIKYENMSKGAEQRTLEKRGDWIKRHLGDVSQTFSKLAITPDDLAQLQREIAADQALVHAAYYTDDECIARIADWMAGAK